MLEGKAMIEDTDMPLKMQIQAMASASHSLDLFDVSDCKSIAAHIKKVQIPTQILPPFFLDVTLSILGNFELDVTLLFWVITSLYLSPITCSHGTILFSFYLSLSTPKIT